MSVCGILAAHAFSHFVIHRGAILAALAAGAAVPAWLWGALFAPELLACCIIGWRLSSWGQVISYAIAGAVARQACEVAFHLGGEPAHAIEGPRAALVSSPVVALVYALLLGLASASGRQDRQLDRA